jgi:hypothetical protein
MDGPQPRRKAVSNAGDDDRKDNDVETLIRVTRPQDVYNALDLLHTRCMDNLPEDSPFTVAIGKFLDAILDLDKREEIRP